MSETTKQKLINRRATKGFNPTESATLLEKTLNHFTTDNNLASALVYLDFATERQAEKAVAEIA